MKSRLIRSSIELRHSAISGYGVFATKNLKKGEIIEECPFILLKDMPAEFVDYKFYSKNKEASGIPFGYGCLYNHAELPNAACEFDENNQLLTFKALKNIYMGDEILTYYSPLWFSLRGKKLKNPYLPKNLFPFLTRIAFIIMLFFILIIALFPFSPSQQKPSEKLLTENITYKKPLPLKLYSSFQKQEHLA